MSDKTRTRIAFAEAVVQMLWIKGLITTKERDQIAHKTGERLLCSKC